AWRMPSSKMPIATAPANRIQKRLVLMVRRTLRRRSTPRDGGVSYAAETAPGADVSCRPRARAAALASALRRADWPALSGSPKVLPDRVVGAGVELLPAPGDGVRAAGTTIAGPLVSIQTKATPSRDAAMKTSAVERQPAVSISPAA